VAAEDARFAIDIREAGAAVPADRLEAVGFISKYKVHHGLHG
jgi:hypothetical protein